MRLLTCCAAAAVVLTGCSPSGGKTVHKTGVIGQTLTGPGGLQITPSKYRPIVPAPAHDVTGLATPARGTHFASFLIAMCITTTDLPTIAAQNFGLELADGSEAALKFPQDVFSSDLDLLGEAGCERGHIVFQVPSAGHPSKLTFKLDASRPDNVNGGSSFDTHVRLEWSV
jgi:hypothetical protein